MALLKEGVDISLTADSFWVHHDAQVCWGIRGVRVMGLFGACVFQSLWKFSP
jgi:hypothetical protein